MFYPYIIHQHSTALHLLYKSDEKKQLILLKINCKSTAEDNRKSVFESGTFNYLLTGTLPHIM